MIEIFKIHCTGNKRSSRGRNKNTFNNATRMLYYEAQYETEDV